MIQDIHLSTITHILIPMITEILLIFFVLQGVSAGSVECIQRQHSNIAGASNCWFELIDDTTLSWRFILNFKTHFQWEENSLANLLGDILHPRFPYWPLESFCNTRPGTYEAGQSISIECTQTFQAIPKGYVNLVYAFEDTDEIMEFCFEIIPHDDQIEQPLSTPKKSTFNSINLNLQSIAKASVSIENK